MSAIHCPNCGVLAGVDNGPQKGDAYLIASAPEMLEMLEMLEVAKQALHAMRHATAPNSAFTEAVDALDAAISKATRGGLN